MPSAAIIVSALSPLFVNAKEYILVLGCVCIILIPIILFMRPRRFYFVRHGETILNASHIRQGKDGALSENGRAQTHRVGLSLMHFHITRIISSPFERARETAMIINEYLKVPISYADLFAERRNPTEIIGKHDDDPEVARIVDQMDRAYHDDAYRFSDEENFQDLKNRAHDALGFLSRTLSRETCVVTHSIFLKMLIAYLLYREDIHATDYAKLSFFNASDNANITICEFHPWKLFSKTRGWEVISYNETPEK